MLVRQDTAIYSDWKITLGIRHDQNRIRRSIIQSIVDQATGFTHGYTDIAWPVIHSTSSHFFIQFC